MTSSLLPELTDLSKTLIFHKDTFGRARKAMSAAKQEIESLRIHLEAMCAWAELLADERQWTRENAASFYASYDAAKEAL